MNPYAIFAAIIAAALLLKKSKASPASEDNAPSDSGGSSFPNRPVTAGGLNDAFQDCIDLFGADMAKKVEKVFRLETANFTSGQFRKTYSAGMTGVKNQFNFPFGWGSLRTFVEGNPEIGLPSDFYLVPMKDAGNPVNFVGFPNLEGSVLFTAYMINKRGGDPATWHSTDPERRQEYNRRLSNISTPIVDDLLI